MIRVLVYGLYSGVGGLEKMIFDIYNNINTEEFEFEFILEGNENADFSEHSKAINKNKLIVHTLPPLRKNIIVSLKKWDEFFKKNSHRFDIIWCNQSRLSQIACLRFAKKYGIKKRIIHSHNTEKILEKTNILLKILHNFNKMRIDRYATDFFACSDEAAKFFYPPKILKKYNFISNSIEVEQYLFDEDKRKVLRKNLQISEDDIVIGNVGRLTYQKNQEFVINVFKEINNKQKNTKLLLIGRGDDTELRKQVNKLGLNDYVMFLGGRDDINSLLSVMDVYLFPSRFEGLPVILLEVQANGLPILASDVISKQTIVNKNYKSLSLGESIEIWADKTLKLAKTNRLEKNIVKENLEKNNFEIKKYIKRIEKILKK